VVALKPCYILKGQPYEQRPLQFSDGLTAAIEAASAYIYWWTPAAAIRQRHRLRTGSGPPADHVVTREEDIRIGLPDGKILPATVAGRDPGSDLAVLRLAEKALAPAKPAKSAKVGQVVLALGRPSSAGVQASFGILTSINGPARTWRGGLLDQFYQSETIPTPASPEARSWMLGGALG
jgi:hypothetical protein